VFSLILRYVKTHKQQLLRFGLVGAFTFSLNYSLVFLFYGKLMLDYRIAVSGAYFFTVVVHFFLNRSFTYRQSEYFLAHAPLRYCVMLVINYLITLTTVTVTVNILKLTPYHGVFFSAFATALSSFFIMKYFVFNQKVKS
jgi:putative flippase GtrA